MGKNRFDDGRDAIKLAEKRGCDVRRGKGDHVVVYSPDRDKSIVIPDRELGNGLGCKIWKWFKLVGLLVFIAFIIVYFYL